MPTDLTGNIVLRAVSNAMTLDSGTSASSGGQTLGTHGTRLQSITFEGDSQIDVIDTAIISQSFIFNSSGIINFVRSTNYYANTTSTNGTITLLQDVAAGGSITLNCGQPTAIGAIVTDTTVVNLNTFTWNAGALDGVNGNYVIIGDPGNSGPPTLTSSSRLIFLASNLIVNTTFDPGQNVIGKIAVEGVNNNTPSTLDFATSASLTVNLDVDYHSFSGSYTIFVATNGATINPPSQSHNPPLTASDAVVNIIRPNAFYDTYAIMRESQDGNTYYIDVTSNIIPLPATIVLSTNTQNILNHLIAGAQADPSGRAAASLRAAGATDTLAEAADNVTGLEVTALSLVGAEDTTTLNNANISTRYITTDILTAEDGAGASAGSEVDIQRGIWISGLGSSSIQKSYSAFAGYKSRTYGGTIGFDIQIAEDVLLGIAYTKANSVVKQAGSVGKAKAGIDTNIFSIYGSKIMGCGWVLQGTLSGGLNFVKVSSLRKNGKIGTFAHGKYKSKYYGVSAELSKKFGIKNSGFVLEPMLGLSYSNFADDAYSEHGGITNWDVYKRGNDNVEGLIGLRLLRDFNYNRWLFKPYLAGYAHVTIRDKRDEIRTSLDNSIGAVKLEQPKASKVWYSSGVGISATKGALEIGMAYEAQIDKKYLGHNATIKARWEF